MIRIFVCTLFILSVGISSQATEQKEMRRTFRQLKLDLGNLHNSKLVRSALNFAVETGIRVISVKGYKQEAIQLRNEWREIRAAQESGFLDLGDHAPMSAQVAKIYDRMETILGENVMSMLGLTDIKILNYAPRVVFQPKGDKRSGETWDDIEYKKHFVPFAEAAAFWTTKLSCQYAIKAKGIICSVASSAFKNIMGKFVAPKLSDKIYNKFGPHGNGVMIANLD